MIMRPRINLIPGTARVTPTIGNLFTSTGVFVLPNGVDDTDAIQAAIDSVARLSAAGGVATAFGGVVQLVAGLYKISRTLWIYPGVILRGANPDATIIELLPGSNCTMIKSGGNPDLRATTDPMDFDNLLGTGLWDGTPQGFGLQDLGLSGNRAQQTAGSGVEFYGKRLYCNNVIIHDIYDKGWFSTNGNDGGQASYHDMPESQIGPLWIRRCNNVGFHFMGPHDANISNLLVAGGVNGIILEADETSEASVDIGHIHQYNATGIGVKILRGCRIDTLIAENNGHHGVQIDAWECQISKVLLYKNCKTQSGSFIEIGGGRNIISQIMVKDMTSVHLPNTTAKAVSIIGRQNQVLGIAVQASATAPETSKCSIGIDIDNDFGANMVEGVVMNCTEGIGLRTGATNPSVQNYVNLSLVNNKTQWQNVTAGSLNVYEIQMKDGAATITGFTGAGPNINKTERWRADRLLVGGTWQTSSTRKLSGADVDMTSTALVSRTLAHDCFVTPKLEDIQLTFQAPDAGPDFRWDIFPYVVAVTDTTVQVKYKLGTAGTGTGKLIMWVQI